MKSLCVPVLILCSACATAPSNPASTAAAASCCEPGCCDDPDCCVPGCCAKASDAVQPAPSTCCVASAR